jgi:hypothetical protein
VTEVFAGFNIRETVIFILFGAQKGPYLFSGSLCEGSQNQGVEIDVARGRFAGQDIVRANLSDDVVFADVDYRDRVARKAVGVLRWRWRWRWKGIFSWRRNGRVLLSIIPGITNQWKDLVFVEIDKPIEVRRGLREREVFAEMLDDVFAIFVLEFGVIETGPICVFLVLVANRLVVVVG